MTDVVLLPRVSVSPFSSHPNSHPRKGTERGQKRGANHQSYVSFRYFPAREAREQFASGNRLLAVARNICRWDPLHDVTT